MGSQRGKCRELRRRRRRGGQVWQWCRVSRAQQRLLRQTLLRQTLLRRRRRAPLVVASKVVHKLRVGASVRCAPLGRRRRRGGGALGGGALGGLGLGVVGGCGGGVTYSQLKL